MFTPTPIRSANGALQAEVSFSADGSVTWPSLYQKADGTIDSIVGTDAQGGIVQTKVPAQPQDFAWFGNRDALQTMNGVAQFSQPNSYTKIQEGLNYCNYRSGVNGFTLDELILAGPNWQQQIRTRVLGGVGRFPHQIYA